MSTAGPEVGKWYRKEGWADARRCMRLLPNYTWGEGVGAWEDDRTNLWKIPRFAERFIEVPSPESPAPKVVATVTMGSMAPATFDVVLEYDETNDECERCGKPGLERIFGKVAFRMRLCDPCHLDDERIIAEGTAEREVNHVRLTPTSGPPSPTRDLGLVGGWNRRAP